MKTVKTCDKPNKSKLVRGDTILEMFWEPDDRPTKETLRLWSKAGTIPYVQIGHGKRQLLFYNPDAVAEALEKKMVGIPRK